MKTKILVIETLLLVIAALAGHLLVGRYVKGAQKHYSITVVWDSTDVSGYEVKKEGICEAATDYGVQITFVTAVSAARQLQVLQREIDYGVDAVLIQAADDKKLRRCIASAPIPVLTFDSVVEGNVAQPLNEADRDSLLELFAKYGRCGRYVYVSNERDALDKRRRTEFFAACRQMGADGYAGTLREAVEQFADERVLLVCKSEKELQLAAGLDTRHKSWQLAGWGQTLPVYQLIQSGQLARLIVINDFGYGYWYIQRAYEELTGASAAKGWLKYMLIDRETIYDHQYQNLLTGK